MNTDFDPSNSIHKGTSRLDVPPHHPSPPPPKKAFDAKKEGTSFAWTGKGGWGSFKRWMGKKNFEQFEKNLCNEISRQISHDKQREKAAADQLKKAETGEDMYQ